jgi:hypothetical protein
MIVSDRGSPGSLKDARLASIFHQTATVWWLQDGSDIAGTFGGLSEANVA